MINQKKNNNNNVLLNLLFKSKSFYGKVLKKTHNNSLPFIYGLRYNFIIINIKYIFFFLKNIFKLIKLNIKQKKKILIIGNSNDIKFLINRNLIKNNDNIFFFSDKWINGLITNKNININKNHLIYFLKKNNINLIFIIKSNLNEEFLSKELSVLRVPIISFMNIDQNLNNIDYPVLTNLNNIKSLYTLMYLIRKIF
jgi:ribosomal protein S2